MFEIQSVCFILKGAKRETQRPQQDRPLPALSSAQAAEEQLSDSVPKAWIFQAALTGLEGQQLPSLCSISANAFPGRTPAP